MCACRGFRRAPNPGRLSVGRQECAQTTVRPRRGVRRGRCVGSACKPRSVQCGLRFTGDPSSRLPHLGDHLSRLRRCRLARAAYPGLNGWAPIAPAWPCSGWGLPGRRHCCRRRWSLTPPFHPDPSLRWGGCFLWPCPQVSLTGSCPAPCPMERGLSSSGRPQSTWGLAARGRPADPALSPSYRPSAGSSTPRHSHNVRGIRLPHAAWARAKPSTTL